jgi:hypothetical protein
MLVCLLFAGFPPYLKATALAECFYVEPFAGTVVLRGDSLYAFLHPPAKVSVSTEAVGAAVGFKLTEPLAVEAAFLKSSVASQSLAVALPPTGPSTNPIPKSGDFSFRSPEWRMGVTAKQTWSERWCGRLGAGVAFRRIEVANLEYPFSEGSTLAPVVGGPGAPAVAVIPQSIWRSFKASTFYLRAGVCYVTGKRVALTFDYSYSGAVMIREPDADHYGFPATGIVAHRFLVGMRLSL